MNNCPHPEDLTAWHLGELNNKLDEEHIAQHFQKCKNCQAIVREEQILANSLRGISEKKIEISNRVSRKIKQRKIIYKSFELVGGLGVAMFLIYLFNIQALIFPELKPKNNKQANAKILNNSFNWLQSNQEADGSWNTEKIKGRKEYALGLSSLTMNPMAIDKSNKYSITLQKTLNFILSSQKDNGCFGKEFPGSMYNQGLVTTSLLQLYKTDAYSDLKEPIFKSINYIVMNQNVDGGWGVAGVSNMQIACWPIRVLLKSKEIGLYNDSKAIDRSLVWLKNYISERGFIDKPSVLITMASTCMVEAKNLGFNVSSSTINKINKHVLKKIHDEFEVVSNNYCHLYFSIQLMYSLKLSPREMYDYKKKVRMILVDNMVKDGSNVGTWLAKDTWCKVGGNLYSTSFALASLL
jgi:hypothetical protein